MAPVLARSERPGILPTDHPPHQGLRFRALLRRTATRLLGGNAFCIAYRSAEYCHGPQQEPLERRRISEVRCAGVREMLLRANTWLNVCAGDVSAALARGLQRW